MRGVGWRLWLVQWCGRDVMRLCAPPDARQRRRCLQPTNDYLLRLTLSSLSPRDRLEAILVPGRHKDDKYVSKLQYMCSRWASRLSLFRLGAACAQ